MKNLLFIIFPSYSHINAVLCLARYLERNGHGVFFLGTPFKQFNDYIQLQGLNICDNDSIPFGLNYFEELTFYKRKGQGFSELLHNRINGNLFDARRSAIDSIIKTHCISAIFLDTFIGADFLCFYHQIKDLSIRLFYITTMNPGIYKKGGIKLTGSASLQKACASKNGWRHLYQMFYLLGFTTAKLIDNKIRELDIKRQTLKFYSKCAIVFDGYKEILLSNEQLTKISWETLYLGLQVDVDRKEKCDIPDEEKINKLKNHHTAIIYISFGTLYKLQEMEKVFKSLIEAASRLKSYTFVFGNLSNHITGKEIADLKQIENIVILGHVPQLRLLSMASLFIMPGGFNSLKEALYFGVPVFTIPLSKTHDQYLTGKLVDSLGIGLTLPVKKANKKRTIAAISSILKNEAYRQRAGELKDILKNHAQTDLTLLTSSLNE